MEGILGKREDGDRVYVPQGWVDVSVSYYVSESFSLFGDFSAKVGWDTGMDSFPYDVSGSLSGSLRGDSFFIGLEGGLRGTRSYDSPRQLEAYLSSNLSYVMEESSLFLKPFVQTVLGPTDSITFALEPGIERLLGEGWMVALSFRPSITYYSDESSEVSLEPRLTLDWFPSVPFTANLRGGWSQRWSDNSDVLQESVFGALELIWYPALNTILRLDTIVEQVYRGMYTLNKGLTISSNMEIRLGLPFPKNSWDLIFGGGYQWKIYSEDPQASDEWFVRVGFEVKL
ncbi:MAG: hypothetical protein N2442_02925 [Spirochaetes bacterium]|nr:hypothetical protein [Spirochaetota bacterium]